MPGAPPPSVIATRRLPNKVPWPLDPHHESPPRTQDSGDLMDRLTGERVIVIGAGVAGLTAAFRLRQAGAEVVVLEASDRVGGRMWTERVGDYLLDTGASVLNSSYRQMVRLIADAGLTDQVVPTPGVIGVLRDGRVHGIDAGKHPGMGLLRSRLLSPASKLKATRLLRDLYKARHTLRWDDLSDTTPWDESAEAYSRRHLNEELLEYVVGPLGRAMNLVDADRFNIALSLFTLQHYLLGGSYFNSPAGMSFLPLGLARNLDVRLGRRVGNIEAGDGDVEVTWSEPDGSQVTERAGYCVLATPGPEALRLFPQVHPEGRDYFTSLKIVRSIQIMFGLAKPTPEKAIWVNVPRAEHQDLFVWINDHNRAPGRAPAGKGLMTFSWRDQWCAEHWDQDDDSVVESALAEISGVGILKGFAEQVEMTCVRRWYPCAPTRYPGSSQALRRFLGSLPPTSRVRFAGDYFSAATTNTSVSSGERAARDIITFAGSGHAPVPAS
ncbi:FAD-dependent oxidoreductase [Streptomyces sp. NPDC047061]|uniref:protoporphyrinogen/coproporphyrinogen oxidase n=1 Tax=Streptomyces sp. NPDC047061 TaxID=3154605 RepID=UPI0033F8FF5C